MTPAPPAAPARKSGGCLKGCGVSLVILLALVIFSVGAVKRWLVPWLAERVRTAQEQNPLAAWAAEQAGVKNPFDESATVGAAPAGRKAGSADRAALPPDIALADGALAEAVNLGPEQLSVFQRLATTPADAAAQHARAMQRLGWKVTASKRGDGRLVVSEKPALGCAADFLAVDGATEVFLRCSGLAPEPDAADGGASATH